MNHILNALARRRSALKNEDRGFSLVELLVVVLIIGVLAAVAIPMYLGSVATAREESVRAAVTNAKSQYVTQVFEGGGKALTAAELSAIEAENESADIFITITAGATPDDATFRANWGSATGTPSATIAGTGGAAVVTP